MDNDPFGVSKAARLKVWKPKRNPGKAEQYVRRAARGAKTKYHNATNQGATNITPDFPKPGVWQSGPARPRPFGEKHFEQKEDSEGARMHNWTLGLGAGGLAGAAGGIAVHGQQSYKDASALQQHERSKIKKARARLITDVGTGAHWLNRPMYKPGYLAGGAAIGGTLSYGAASLERKANRKELQTRYKNQERRKAKATPTAPLAKRRAELERYTPTKKENAKYRAGQAVSGAGLGAGLYGGYKAFERASYTKPYRKLHAPYKAKPALVAAATGAAIFGAGKLDKEQYRVKKNDPFGIAKKDGRKRGIALATGGAATLGATTQLPRVERAVVRHKTGKIDAQINALNASKPPKPTPRMNQWGQKIATGSKKEKIERGAHLKRITGQVSELERAKKLITRPHLAGNAKATWTGIAVGAPALWYGSRQSVSKLDDTQPKTGHRRDVDVGILGAAAGAGGYQEASYALKPFDRRAEQKIKDNPDLNRQAHAYQKKMRPKNAKAGDAAWRPYFRNYPKHLPGARLKRTLAVTHTGRSGGALTAAAGLAGAAGAVHLDRKYLRPKEGVAKYQSPSTPPPTPKRIAHQKKAQAGFSLVGGTLGLTALASRGRAAQLTRRAKKVEGGIPAVEQAAQRWKDRSTALTTAGAGVGGVGAYNFASYTNAEANKTKKVK